MTQRKKFAATSNKSATAKSRASSKSKSTEHTEARSAHHPSVHHPIDPMSGYSKQLMHESTPGPLPQRDVNDPLLDIDAIDSKRNRVRMWSYKAAGLKM